MGGGGFWFLCVCLSVFVCVPKTPMHLLRPGDRGKVYVESFGWEQRGGGKEQRKKKERKKKFWV